MKRLFKFTLPVLAVCGVIFASGSVLAGDGYYKKNRMNNHFSTMDSNDDGMVSREEHLDNAAKRFDAADANGDGMLSKEEIKKSFIKQRKEKTKKLEEAS